MGDDQQGNPLEVIAIEFEPEDLRVIHAMPLRQKYRLEYEEAKRWLV